MTQRFASVLNQAMELTADERAELTDLLVDSLPPPADLEPLDDKSLADEITRRAVELKADPTAGIPWDQVREMR